MCRRNGDGLDRKHLCIGVLINPLALLPRSPAVCAAISAAANNASASCIAGSARHNNCSNTTTMAEDDGRIHMEMHLSQFWQCKIQTGLSWCRARPQTPSMSYSQYPVRTEYMINMCKPSTLCCLLRLFMMNTTSIAFSAHLAFWCECVQQPSSCSRTTSSNTSHVKYMHMYGHISRCLILMTCSSNT